MKLFAVLLLCTVGMAYSATLNPQCSICKTTLDWVRTNDNVLSFMRSDEEVSDEVLALLESDVASEDVCAQFSMCETDAGELNYMTVLRGGGGRRGHGGHGGHRSHGSHGHGHGIHNCIKYGDC